MFENYEGVESLGVCCFYHNFPIPIWIFDNIDPPYLISQRNDTLRDPMTSVHKVFVLAARINALSPLEQKWGLRQLNGNNLICGINNEKGQSSS